MRAADGITFSNISADTAEFPLEGGKYLLAASATWGGGGVELQMLGPDGNTFISLFQTDLATPADVNVGTLKANGAKVIEVPPCMAKLVVITATAVYAGVYRIPGE